jgi:two-component system chemotaxis response regulator CheY
MTPHHARLLVVDDSKSIRQMIRDLMKELGFATIDEAPDGLAAFELFQANTYAAVLTDWNMPFVSGMELLKSIRQGQVRPHTPVVLFTGEVSPRRVVEAMESGANGFVTKPFVTATLCDKVLRIVASVPPVTDFIPTARPPRPQARPRV